MISTSLEKVNSFVLHKQHLTDDSKTDNIVQIVKDIAGLHSTSSTTPYLSLLARTHTFTKEQLDEELYVKKNLGKIRCVRKTVYILPKELIPAAFSATKAMVEPASEKYSQYLGITHTEYVKMAKLILRLLKGKTMTASQIKDSLETGVNVSPVVNLMCDQGLLIRGKPAKGWKSSIHTYQLFEDYFPELDLNTVDKDAAKELLVRSYIASFGPVTENDVSWWLGFSKRETRQILERLSGQMSQLEISRIKASFFMLKSDLHSFEASSTKGETVNLLPTLDPYLMGYKDRERYLSNEHYSNVFDRSGNATSTILLNGRVIGVWDVTEKPKPTVKLLLFKDVKEVVFSKIRAIAARTGKFIFNKDVTIKECESMVPLTQRTAGGVMSPLKGC